MMIESEWVQTGGKPEWIWLRTTPQKSEGAIKNAESLQRNYVETKKAYQVADSEY